MTKYFEENVKSMGKGTRAMMRTMRYAAVNFDTYCIFSTA